MKDSRISWTHHTFNGTWGCTQVSPGCDNCYAKKFAERWGMDVWGQDKGRRLFGTKHWEAPLKWNDIAKAEGRRHRVFAYSMGDVFERHQAVVELLPRLWQTIRDTPHLDWLLLTKRANRIEESLPGDWNDHPHGYPNVWLGISAENQHWYNVRWHHLSKVRATVRFISCEPLLGPIHGLRELDNEPLPDWVICGGESAPSHKRRDMDRDWAQQLRQHCTALDVPFWFKQDSDHESGRRPHLLGSIIQELPRPRAAT